MRLRQWSRLPPRPNNKSPNPRARRVSGYRRAATERQCAGYGRSARPTWNAAAPVYFTLPKQNAARENALNDDEILASVEFSESHSRSTYHKVLDREAWTHAVVLDMGEGNAKDVCRQARIVLGGVAPIPWRVPEAERLPAGQRITPDVAAKAAEAAVSGANPLTKNRYKILLTRETVHRSVLAVAVGQVGNLRGTGSPAAATLVQTHSTRNS